MNFIEQCEQEKLHLSGAIQPHGALIVLTKEGVVTHYSANLADMKLLPVEINVGEVLPTPIKELLDSVPAELGKHHVTQISSMAGEVCYVVVSQTEQAISIEFYPSAEARTGTASSFSLPTIFNDSVELEHFRNELLKWIAELTEHERVMYYQFMENNDGLVVAEVCDDQARGTYLDLRFPASDIPQIARALYAKNPWREIPSAQAEAVAVMGDADRPDLSYVDLRSVSPVHQIYMKNMGVESSVSFAVMKNDRLDALISCHSSAPKFIPREHLFKIHEAISRFSFLLRELDTRQRLELIDEFNIKTQGLRELLSQSDSVESVWPTLASTIKDEFAAESVVLCVDSHSYVFGSALSQDEVSALDHWYTGNGEARIFHTDHIREVIDDMPLSEIAGFAALRFRAGENKSQVVRLYMTRKEFLYEVQWGGNPNKPVETLDGGMAISPRQSFSKWVEKRLGYSKPWSGHVTLELHRLRSLLETSKAFEGEV